MASTSTSYSSSPPGSPPKKKRHVESKWQSEWTKYRMTPSKKGSTYAYCTVCNCDISVAGGGVHEVKRHCRSVKHRSLFEGLQDQPSLPVTLARAHTENSFRDKVLKSEIFFARFIAEHNTSFATADHFTGLCKCMFPDSKIAEAFSCARTKTCDSCTWSSC